jgi:hypothetical protein
MTAAEQKGKTMKALGRSDFPVSPQGLSCLPSSWKILEMIAHKTDCSSVTNSKSEGE